MEEQEKVMSLRTRRKKSSIGITCCFTGATRHHRRASLDTTSYSTFHPSPLRSPSAWFKSRSNDLPEIKGKCRNFISRMARHRRHSSADFTYDPLSYARNFDDDASSSTAADDDFSALSFSARLPVSPPSGPNLPRSPVPKSTKQCGNDGLRRGFEALSEATSRLERQRRSNKRSSAAAAVGATKAVGMPSPSREVIVPY